MGTWYLALISGSGNVGSGNVGYGYGDPGSGGSGSGNVGYGYGNPGYGDGASDGEIMLKESEAFTALHFIRKDGDGFRLRSGKTCAIGEHLHEPEIVLCEKGLHASFSVENARKYAPPGSVLTEVKVWGQIIIDNDKLVASDRMIVREMPPRPANTRISKGEIR